MRDQKLKLNNLAASWYNTLTLLSVELKVHSLGGGVLVFIPGETDAVEVIDPTTLTNVEERFYFELDEALKDGRLEDAYSLGDKYVLASFGLTSKEISLLADAVKTLRKWRNSRLRKISKTD